MNLVEALQLARQQRTGGNLAEAIKLLDALAMGNPNEPVVFVELGESLRAAGRLDEAVASCKRAISLNPKQPGAHHTLGIALAMAQARPDAIVALTEAARIEPNSPEVYNNLAAVLLVSGRVAEAVEPLQRALTLNREYADAWRNYGAALLRTNRAPEAVEAFRQLVRLRPEDAQAHYRLGDAAATANDLALATTSLERAIELQPDYTAALSRLGSVLRQQGDTDRAIEFLEHAVRLDANNVSTLSNLGEALLFGGRADDAVAPLSRAIELQPDFTAAHVNLGSVRMRQGRTEQAIENFRVALRHAPTFARAHMNYGMALLQTGDFENGWSEVEWRFRLPESIEAHKIYQRFPMWDGGPLDGKTILIHTEQGFGDAIQFVRYVPMIAERGGRIILGCRPELRRLFERIEGVTEIVSTGETLPPFDLQCPIMSLPWAFGTTLATIPAEVPYLSATPEMIDEWQARLLPAPGLKVGLVWAGSPSNTRDRYRSCPPELLAPLRGAPGVTYFKIQKGKPASEGDPPIEMIDHTPLLHDWADTAALMANLDLVISVDTAPAHLAGAVGCNVWTLLTSAGEWRWMRGRDDSPWYPTMRLFRQQTWGDWTGVIERIAQALAERAHR